MHTCQEADRLKLDIAAMAGIEFAFIDRAALVACDLLEETRA